MCAIQKSACCCRCFALRPIAMPAVYERNLWIAQLSSPARIQTFTTGCYGIPLSMVIDRVRASTNEVGGRVLEMNGARYMVRGLGYLSSLKDLEDVSVNSKNGTPVLLRDLATVTFGPDIREGVAEWQGEGEAVGGIIVMRTGENALNVINGIKAKVAEIAPTLPAGVEIHAGYDRSGLISESIRTLQRDLLA